MIAKMKIFRWGPTCARTLQVTAQRRHWFENTDRRSASRFDGKAGRAKLREPPAPHGKPCGPTCARRSEPPLGS